ncbi:P-loop containing nucleoside triphosphate hydrolase protein [Xylaria venustula]|nr:P-loop containing nucleoside triphosphate hydrolase protein [Xylaria venustula]
MPVITPEPTDDSISRELSTLEAETTAQANEMLPTAPSSEFRSPMPSEKDDYQNSNNQIADTAIFSKSQDIGKTQASNTLPKESEEQAKLTRELVKDDETSETEFFRETRSSYFYGRETLEQRRKSAKRRLLQTQAYQSLLEDRMTSLEEKLRKYLDKPEPKNVESPPSEVPNITKEFSELSWSAFRGSVAIEPQASSYGWDHVKELDKSPKAMIEILTEKPRYNEIRTLEDETSTRQRDQKSEAPRPTSLESLDAKSRIPCQEGLPYLIRIRSTLLLKILREITGLQTCIGPHEHILVLFKPFKLFISFADKIRDHFKRLSNGTPSSIDTVDNKVTGMLMFAPNETETDEARECLQILCEVLDKWFKPKIELYSSPNFCVTLVRFDDLWYVFKPGAEVRTRGKSQIQLLRILKVTGGREVLQKWREPPEKYGAVKLKDEGCTPGSFILECFFIHFDGHQYGPVNQAFHIPKFDGERELTSMPVIPLEYDPDRERIRHNLLERGQKFVELSDPTKAAHKKYKGLTLDTRQAQVESNVIIDFELAFVERPENKPTIGVEDLVDDDRRELVDVWRQHTPCDIPGCCGNDIIYNDYEVDERHRNEVRKSPLLDSVWHASQLDHNHMVLLPPKVYGFVLRTRKWASFDIDLLAEVEYKNGWERLVIETEIKDTILALVETHEKPKGEEDEEKERLTSMDLVGGKGNGLIILLHGEPGVGKTSTAECVADHTHRPLFPVTCGDIGDNAQLVETNLERNFQLAHKWGCVLLLDEADIFLSRRNNHDITRNAIVSVFLRTLEYYSGILFLTTNRVGMIDRAFKSRIHLALYYPKLNRETSLKIWENNIESLQADINENKKTFKLETNEIIGFAKAQYKDTKRRKLRPWNGRQIRNAFQTAIAIANFEATDPSATPRLGKSQFEKVAKSAIDFESYLNALYMKDESQIAQATYQRLDDWKGIPVATGRVKPIHAFGRSSRYKGGYDDYTSEGSSLGSSYSEDSSDSGNESDSEHNSRRKSKRRKRSSDSSAGEREGKSKSKSKKKRR